MYVLSVCGENYLLLSVLCFYKIINNSHLMLLPRRRQINITGDSCSERKYMFTCLESIKFNFMKKNLYSSHIRYFFPVNVTPCVKPNRYRGTIPSSVLLEFRQNCPRLHLKFYHQPCTHLIKYFTVSCMLWLNISQYINTSANNIRHQAEHIMAVTPT